MPGGADAVQRMEGKGAAAGVFDKYARGAAGAQLRAKREQGFDDDDFERDDARKAKLKRKLVQE